MSFGSQCVSLLLAIAFLATCPPSSEAGITVENGLKSKVYLSPAVPQHPGLASNKLYYGIDFPKGHIALKSFNAEVVDELGNPIPLQETYLHHWDAVRYYERIGITHTNGNQGLQQSDRIMTRNAGMCNTGLNQFFGLGSETRKTSTLIPDPYGIEFGNPVEVPSGYEEKWMLNVHAIDTRGVVDALGCIECRCSLYNRTTDEHGQPFDPNYLGGLHCCFDKSQCKVKNGLEDIKRSLYLKYTVKWVDWSDSIVPLKIFLIDVTNTWQNTGSNDCLIEYDVEQSTTATATNDYTSVKRSTVKFPVAGHVVYGVGHQHTGGAGTALYREDGRVICSSMPVYGKGNGVGDEAGYLVGMSTCYPKPGSVKIGKGEILIMESNYSSEKSHVGVMGIFYILLAESTSELDYLVQVHKEVKVPLFFGGVAMFGLAICVVILVAYQRRKQGEDGYQPIAA